jgi:16S rRNA (guanine966-N2)-methyltransferase
MRIVGGQHKGFALSAPAGRLVRPTSDRTREALFNILTHERGEDGWSLTESIVLDLFAGSGALGLEALSRGARFALFLEQADVARAAIRRNIEALNLEGRTRLWRRNATKLGELPAGAGGPFNLIFCDPPYAEGRNLITDALHSALAGGWITWPARIIIEQASGDRMPQIDGTEWLDTRSYGAAQISFFRPISSSAEQT